MLIGIPSVISRDAEYHVLGLIGSFFLPKGCEENLPVTIGFLKVGGVRN